MKLYSKKGKKISKLRYRLLRAGTMTNTEIIIKRKVSNHQKETCKGIEKKVLSLSHFD